MGASVARRLHVAGAPSGGRLRVRAAPVSMGCGRARWAAARRWPARRRACASPGQRALQRVPVKGPRGMRAAEEAECGPRGRGRVPWPPTRGPAPAGGALGQRAVRGAFLNRWLGAAGFRVRSGARCVTKWRPLTRLETRTKESITRASGWVGKPGREMKVKLRPRGAGEAGGRVCNKVVGAPPPSTDHALNGQKIRV